MALHEMYEAVGLAKYLPLKILAYASLRLLLYSFDNKILMPVIFFTLALFALYMKKTAN